MTNTFLELVKESRSIRSYNRKRPVTEGELTDLLECARFAPSANNRQLLRYRLCHTEDDMAALLPTLKWAAALPNWHLPPEGHEPPAAIVLCHDAALEANVQASARDVGITAQTILLAAREHRLGGCMIANFRPEAVSAALRLPRHLIPVLTIAIGEPDETIRLEDMPDGGSTAYWRDESGVHHVPKRALDALIVK